MPLQPLQNTTRVSQRDIARKAGVSHVTVSLALRNDPRITEATRLDIEAIAKRLEYKPDPMLSSLSFYRHTRRPAVISSAIAWLNQWTNPKELRHYQEFDAYWRGARDTAERLGYRLEEFVVTKEKPDSRVEKILLTRNVRGILIPPHRAELELPDFDWSRFSIVRFGLSVTNPAAHIVMSDQTECTRLAFARVQEKAYKRIGYVSTRGFEQFTKWNFCAGYLSCQESLPMEKVRLPLLLLDDKSKQGDIETFCGWMSEHRPDAIISPLGSLSAMLADIGYDVPNDIAVATLSILDGNFDSGVDQNSYDVGSVAMSTLAALIHQNERGVPPSCRRILVGGRWVEGGSLPRRSLSELSVGR